MFRIFFRPQRRTSQSKFWCWTICSKAEHLGGINASAYKSSGCQCICLFLYILFCAEEVTDTFQHQRQVSITFFFLSFWKRRTNGIAPTSKVFDTFVISLNNWLTFTKKLPFFMLTLQFLEWSHHPFYFQCFFYRYKLVLALNDGTFRIVYAQSIDTNDCCLCKCSSALFSHPVSFSFFEFFEI